MPSSYWKSLTRVADWQEAVANMKLGQNVFLENITKKEFEYVFDTMCLWGVTVKKVKRSFDNHFNVVLQKIGICYHNKHRRIVLAQMMQTRPTQLS